MKVVGKKGEWQQLIHLRVAAGTCGEGSRHRSGCPVLPRTTAFCCSSLKSCCNFSTAPGAFQQDCGAGAEGILTTLLFVRLKSKVWTVRFKTEAYCEQKMKADASYCYLFVFIGASSPFTRSLSPPIFSFGWIAGFEESSSSCQLSSFAFEPYLSPVSWFLTKGFCCLSVLQRGLFFSEKRRRKCKEAVCSKFRRGRSFPPPPLVAYPDHFPISPSC